MWHVTFNIGMQKLNKREDMNLIAKSSHSHSLSAPNLEMGICNFTDYIF